MCLHAGLCLSAKACACSRSCVNAARASLCAHASRVYWAACELDASRAVRLVVDARREGQQVEHVLEEREGRRVVLGAN
eukprot:3356869-Pleurochrysis_carterae.AAC.1